MTDENVLGGETMKFKRMRFNLRFPDPAGNGNFVTIHSVKELRDCLVDYRTIAFDDLIDYFRNGQLHRWLECLDAKEEDRASKIKKLFEDSRGKAVANFAKSLLDLLGLDVDDDEEVVNNFVRDYIISPEKMLQDKMRARKDFDAYNKKAEAVIEGFREDKKRLLLMKTDLKALRKNIVVMLKLYGGQLMLEEFCFIEFLKNECPLGALALLTLPEGQQYKDKFPKVFEQFITVKILNNKPTILLNENIKLEKEHPYLLSGDNAPVKVYREPTSRKFETIVQGGKNVLLLWSLEYFVCNFFDYGATVRAKDQFTGDEVNRKFRVFNGLDVLSVDAKSAWQQPFLVYMEVPDNDD